MRFHPQGKVLLEVFCQVILWQHRYTTAKDHGQKRLGIRPWET